MTINEAVLFEAQHRPVSGDPLTRMLAAGADFYPAPQWPTSQRKPVNGWQQPLADMRLNEQLGTRDISARSGNTGGLARSQGWGMGRFGMGAFGVGEYGQHGGG